MSILLKEIEMPECCMNCPLSVSVNFGLVCCPTSTILPDSKLFDDDGKALEKPSWCPIIEVPEDVQFLTWIPVTERLPNGNGEYLVSGKDKVWVCEFMILGDVGGWCNSAMNPCVKYWMPLPELPKEKANGQ